MKTYKLIYKMNKYICIKETKKNEEVKYTFA